MEIAINHHHIKKKKSSSFPIKKNQTVLAATQQERATQHERMTARFRASTLWIHGPPHHHILKAGAHPTCDIRDDLPDDSGPYMGPRVISSAGPLLR